MGMLSIKPSGMQAGEEEGIYQQNIGIVHQSWV